MAERIYQVPASVMNGIADVMNSLPYGQVAPLAASIGALVAQQNQQMDAVEKESADGKSPGEVGD